MKTRQLAVLATSAIMFAATSVVGGTDVRVATWNIETVGEPVSVEYLAGLSILNRIGADVVAVNGVSGAADSVNLHFLAADAGYPFVVVSDDSPFDTMRNAFISKLPIISSDVHTAAGLSGDPSANDLTRFIVSVKIDVPDVERHLVLITEHWKSGSGDDSEFRRAVESQRVVDVVELQAPGDAFLIVGDVNEEIDSVPRSPNPFVSLPAGLPPGWTLGADLAAELASPGIENDPFARILSRVMAVGALQLDGSDATRPASGRRLDYIFVSEFVDGGVGETYDSADEGLPGALPKFGSPPAPNASSDASDHLMVFADIVVPELPIAEPALPPDNALIDIEVGGVLWDPGDDFFNSSPDDLYYRLEREDKHGTFEFFSSSIDPGFTDVDDPADTPPFTPDHRVRFDFPSWTDSTTYWWRVSAREAGSATWGAWSEWRSFTYDSASAPPAPLADWHQTTTDQFLMDQLNNVTAVGDALVITEEVMPGSIQTPLIDLGSLHTDESAVFSAWKNVVVNAAQPDNSTSVTVEVYNDSGLLVAGPEVDSGAGTRDITVDLGLVTDPVIYLVVTLTPGSTPVVHSITVSGDASATGIEDGQVPSTQYALYQNVPNPFNPETVIRYDVPPPGGELALRVYDVTGRFVRTLVNRVEAPGAKAVRWNGRNEFGQPVASGVYFYRLTAGSFTETKKMVTLK